MILCTFGKLQRFRVFGLYMKMTSRRALDFSNSLFDARVSKQKFKISWLSLILEKIDEWKKNHVLLLEKAYL